MMSVEEKEKLIVKLNDERRKVINVIKNNQNSELAKKYEVKLENINKQIEDLIK